MNGFFAGIVGAFSDAAQEVRVHRGRVLLSLVGVAAAVTALTVSMAFADIAQRTVVEQMETYMGRPTTLDLNAMPKGELRLDQVEQIEDAWFAVMDRSDVSYATREANATARMRFSDGAQEVSLQIVDQPYATMRHTRMLEGSWFAPGDSQRLAPAIVVSRSFHQALGSPDLRTHPTIVSPGLGNARLVIIGVYDGPLFEGMMPEAMMLTSSYRQVASETDVVSTASGIRYQMWVPQDIGEELGKRIEQSMSSALGTDFSVNVYNNNQGGMDPSQDPTVIFRLLSLGIGAIILILGALGLVNIAIVSVRQRVREIGVRRSFGASTGRVFFSVMMESVVATVVAGFVGVMIAILIMRIPAVYGIFTGGAVGTGAPAFPVGAAVTGMVAATIVGALAGLIPAIIATRVKVIDALRY
ncbi:putative ABC transport system permease protein [Mycetocola sp. BIGb0189]|uniref:ABC transporter permease n=1 Tax=Mycetocola sp. BIGb0189 TaxID=2940604 RepID=UPI0021671002|nr:ABC transporter permease [Mycetocola sp. BIGb0189]MCS4275076.1 putative ABC transport system permease protein [Mycetocola sp. BIGb0189]